MIFFMIDRFFIDERLNLIRSTWKEENGYFILSFLFYSSLDFHQVALAMLFKSALIRIKNIYLKLSLPLFPCTL
ncbi:hypothetical protein AVL50_07735 [Flammeovirga sp. SJP92]|nr:hypothetical protein AVL50_07735 [Flammeovirga sp. SJP92]